MTLRFCMAGAICSLVLASCSDTGADQDGNGVIDSAERAAEMDYDAFIPMKPGLWETKFEFSDINLPTLGKAEKRQIMEEVAKGSSSRRCLSAEEAKKPGADFFGGEGAEKCVYKSFDVAGQSAKLSLTCAIEGMGTIDMKLAGVMGETEFDYETQVDLRLPMVGKVRMKGNAAGKYIGACPAE